MNKVNELNGWLVKTSEDGQYVYLARDGSAGQIQVKADDEGFVVDIFDDSTEPESVGSTYAAYSELAIDDDSVQRKAVEAP